MDRLGRGRVSNHRSASPSTNSRRAESDASPGNPTAGGCGRREERSLTDSPTIPPSLPQRHVGRLKGPEPQVRGGRPKGGAGGWSLSWGSLRLPLSFRGHERSTARALGLKRLWHSSLGDGGLSSDSPRGLPAQSLVCQTRPGVRWWPAGSQDCHQAISESPLDGRVLLGCARRKTLHRLGP